jgi:ribosomal-protein-alanine N-acetyltransferase
LHLSEHHGDACPGACVFVQMHGVADLHGELAARDYPYARPRLEAQPWGLTELTVTDPFGNRLRFAEPTPA